MHKTIIYDTICFMVIEQLRNNKRQLVTYNSR